MFITLFYISPSVSQHFSGFPFPISFLSHHLLFHFIELIKTGNVFLDTLNSKLFEIKVLRNLKPLLLIFWMDILLMKVLGLLALVVYT